VVTSALGALPETTAGLARLIPPAEDRRAYLTRFVAETVDALQALDGQEAALRRQVAHVVRESTWDSWADRWATCLASL
jgi:hypothetical protein